VVRSDRQGQPSFGARRERPQRHGRWRARCRERGDDGDAQLLADHSQDRRGLAHLVTALGVTPCAASDAGAWAARTPYTLSTKARPRTSAQRRHRRFQPARGEGLCFSLPLLDRAAQTQEEAHPLRPLPSLPCRRAAATRAPNGASEGRLNWAASSPPPRAIGSSQATAGTSAGSPTSATSGTLTTPTRLVVRSHGLLGSRQHALPFEAVEEIRPSERTVVLRITHTAI
jgi:hypothetical protein